MEVLYIFNSIITSDYNSNDIDKLFYKLFAEELAIKGDFVYSLYFAGKYNQHFSSTPQNQIKLILFVIN